MQDAVAVLRFYAASTLIAFLTVPLGRFFFQKSSRHLFLYNRFLGLLLTNFTVWLLSAIGLFAFSVRGILGAMLLLAVLGFVWIRSQGFTLSAGQSWLRRHWRTALFDEVVFVAALIFFVVLIRHQPKIFGTEKNMDFMFLNGLMRGTNIPPHDPWFAGGTINYYYGGYMIMALLGRLSALPPAYTYNIALAFLFASAVALSWALGHQLTGSRRLGALAPLGLAIMGNLNGFLQVLRVGWPYKISYWDSSRVIVDVEGTQKGNTINEFPFFSFIHADLHPHVMAIPFVLLFIAMLYEFLLFYRARSLRTTAPALAGRTVILAIALGSLGFINGLDLPSYGLLFAGVVFFGVLRAFGSRLNSPRRIVQALLIIAALGLLTGLVAYLIHYPFYGTFVKPKHEEGFLGQSIFKSDLGEFLTVFHLQLFWVAVFLGVGLAQLYHRERPELFRLAMAGTGILFVFLFAYYGYFVVAFLTVALLMVWATLLQNLRRPNRLFTWLMLMLAVAILIGCEFVHVKDSYGRQLQRMNTLFKFHYQAWILFAISAPVIFQALRRSQFLPKSMRQSLLAVGVGLLALNLVYPFGVSWARLRQSAESLDGMAYLQREHPGDALAIQWLNSNVRGIPVVLEYPGKRAYDYNSRVSTNTGLPTLIGWMNHEAIWRKQWAKADATARGRLQAAGRNPDGWALVHYRQSLADRIYNSKQLPPVIPLLQEYKIEYIYIGELERRHYTAEGLGKFGTTFEKIYDRNNTLIYRVPDRYRTS